jgi:pilus assembly protein FimV
VLAAGVVGWLFSRRGGATGTGAADVEPADRLEDIRSKAEDVLRTLSEEPADEPPGEETPQEPAEEAEATVVRFPAGEGDAEVLDVESSDPEIQLDLARAYISMGDKEAARVILEEVISNGTERQQAEASKMLDLLSQP